MIKSQWVFYCIVAGPDCASKGVAVLFQSNFEYKIHILKDLQFVPNMSTRHPST